MNTRFRFPIAVKYYARTIGIENAITRAMQFAEGKTPNKLETLVWIKELLRKKKEENSS